MARIGNVRVCPVEATVPIKKSSRTILTSLTLGYSPVLLILGITCCFAVNIVHLLLGVSHVIYQLAKLVFLANFVWVSFLLFAVLYLYLLLIGF